MLDDYFCSPTRLRQLRRGPLGRHLDGLATDLRRQGYAADTAQRILALAGRLSRFAEHAGIADASQVDAGLVHRLLDEELRVEGRYAGAASAMQHVLEYLRHEQVIGTEPAPRQKQFHGDLLDRYEVHLRNVRGLAAGTRRSHRWGAARFLKWCDEHRPGRSLATLSGADVLAFVTEDLQRAKRGGRHLRACQTRSFLRYLRWEGTVQNDLDRAVPKVPRWRLDSLPSHLVWNQVRALVDNVDTSQPGGIRDKAILLVLAMLGLRGGEILKLQCGDILWRRGEIKVRGTKGCRERILPLPHEVGAAIADYLLHARPPVDVPQIFLRHIAPHGPLRDSTSIAYIVARHLRRAGIDAPHHGAHLLRHSLATRMVNVGVPIKDIADVLGHASIDTTAIYTKVDLTNLSSVAPPFPRGGAS